MRRAACEFECVAAQPFGRQQLVQNDAASSLDTAWLPTAAPQVRKADDACLPVNRCRQRCSCSRQPDGCTILHQLLPADQLLSTTARQVTSILSSRAGENACKWDADLARFSPPHSPCLIS